ncbi:hypothetical protein [Streptomyces sp. NPDC057382]|uniref:hypothetical protein n=1 Tax=unclassified Streptomyces TaxID=2593676 RepID=UPI003632E5DC
MSALFRIRLLALTGTHLWFAVSGRLTVHTTHVLRDQLTERCAGARVVVLDLRELDITASGTVLSAPWPEHLHALHVLASTPVRGRLTADARAHWHTTVDTAWQAWSR